MPVNRLFTLWCAAGNILYTARCGAYGPRRFKPRKAGPVAAMRAETQNIVDEIKQAITLLRRHL